MTWIQEFLKKCSPLQDRSNSTIVADKKLSMNSYEIFWRGGCLTSNKLFVFVGDPDQSGFGNF